MRLIGIKIEILYSLIVKIMVTILENLIVFFIINPLGFILLLLGLIYIEYIVSKSIAQDLPLGNAAKNVNEQTLLATSRKITLYKALAAKTWADQKTSLSIVPKFLVTQKIRVKNQLLRMQKKV